MIDWIDLNFSEKEINVIYTNSLCEIFLKKDEKVAQKKSIAADNKTELKL